MAAEDRKPIKINGFFSYSHHDAELNPELIEAFTTKLQQYVNAKLPNTELIIWRDYDKLLVGERFTDKIESQLRKTDLLIVFFSPRWIESESCRKEYSLFKEIEYSHGRHDTIIPIEARPVDFYLTEEQRKIYESIKERHKFHINVSEFLLFSEAERHARVDTFADDITKIIETLRKHRAGDLPTSERQEDVSPNFENRSDGDRSSETAKPQLDRVVLPPVRFVGRKSDVRTLAVSLKAPRKRAAIVLGMPGVGKTTLARQAATDQRVVKRFGQRRWLVPLETADSAALFETEIIRAIGLDPANDKFGRALDELQRQPSLLLLDNLETPWENDVGATEALLERLGNVPNLTILASMRGLEAPPKPQWTPQVELQPLDEKDANILFCSIARKITASDPYLADFFQEHWGVPLAIELIANIAKPLGDLKSLLEEWRRLGVVQFGRILDQSEERLTSIPSSIALSLSSRRLRAEGKRLFGLLGLCPVGMALEDCKKVLGNDYLPAIRQLLAVGLALERSNRLELLPFVRDLSSRAYRPTDVDEELWRDHFLHLVADLGVKIGRDGGREALVRLSPEIPNVEAAYRAALAKNDLRTGQNAVLGFAQVLRFTGIGSPLVLNDLAKVCSSAVDLKGEATSRFWLAVIEQDRSNHEAAREQFQQAEPLYRQDGDKRGEANCIRMLGDIALSREDLTAARELYERAQPLYREVAAVIGEASCIKGIGDIDLARADYERARTSYKLARPLFKQRQDLLGEANCLRGLGDTALARASRGDTTQASAFYDEARERYERALELYRTIGNTQQGEAVIKQRLSTWALQQQDLKKAREYLQDALPRYQQLRDKHGQAECVKGLGDIALQNKNYAATKEYYAKALSLFREISNLAGEANCVGALGDCALAQQHYKAAMTEYKKALELYKKIENIAGQAKCHRGMGDVAHSEYRYKEAQGHYEEARRLFVVAKDMRGESSTITCIGDIAFARKNYALASQAYGDARDLSRKVKDKLSEATCTLRLGDIAMKAGELETARNQYQSALGLFNQSRSALGEARCIRGLGEHALQSEENDAALVNFEEALTQFRRLGDIEGEANCIIGLTEVVRRKGDHATAYEALSTILNPTLLERRDGIRPKDDMAGEKLKELLNRAFKVWAEHARQDVVSALNQIANVISEVSDDHR